MIEELEGIEKLLVSETTDSIGENVKFNTADALLWIARALNRIADKMSEANDIARGDWRP
jgi:hypothetical protein